MLVFERMVEKKDDRDEQLAKYGERMSALFTLSFVQQYFRFFPSPNVHFVAIWPLFLTKLSILMHLREIETFAVH